MGKYMHMPLPGCVTGSHVVGQQLSHGGEVGVVGQQLSHGGGVEHVGQLQSAIKEGCSNQLHA